MIYIWFGILITRLISLMISIRNEKNLKKNGGIEYDKINTRNLTIAHIAFYLGLLIEFNIRQAQWDSISTIGSLIYLFSIIALIFVIISLGKFWTIKLIIATDHLVVDNWFFKKFKHPNYYLNVLPELLGLTLIFHAYFTFLFIMPFYFLFLYKRIRQEEIIMKSKFAGY